MQCQVIIPSRCSSSLPYPALNPGFFRSLYSHGWPFRAHQPQLGCVRSTRRVSPLQSSTRNQAIRTTLHFPLLAKFASELVSDSITVWHLRRIERKKGGVIYETITGRFLFNDLSDDWEAFRSTAPASLPLSCADQTSSGLSASSRSSARLPVLT